MKMIELLTEAAEQFARSQGWRPFDNYIEVDIHLPWTFQDAIKQSIASLSNVIKTNEGKEDVNLYDPTVKFTQLRNHGVIMNLIPDNDVFSISLTKVKSSVTYALGIDAEGKVIEANIQGQGKYPVINPNAGTDPKTTLPDGLYGKGEWREDEGDKISKE